VGGLQEGQEAVQVVVPLGVEEVGRGPFPAGHLDGQLQAVGEQVVVVLHTVVHQVPA